MRQINSSQEIKRKIYIECKVTILKNLHLKHKTLIYHSYIFFYVLLNYNTYMNLDLKVKNYEAEKSHPRHSISIVKSS